MRIDIITIFPEMFLGVLGESILKRGQEKGLLSFHLTNFRDFSLDKHHKVDDTPFGGGSGMVLKPEPIFAALRHVEKTSLEEKRSADEAKNGEKSVRRLLMDPGGETFSQAKAKELAAYDQLIFICGHYEGFDERIKTLADEALSIGDYVLTGGELPAMVIIDAVARMIPGVLGSEESATTDSFYNGLLAYPQYTRPREFEGLSVPDVLLSGDHGKIARWRKEQALLATQKKRPDLLQTPGACD